MDKLSGIKSSDFIVSHKNRSGTRQLWRVRSSGTGSPDSPGRDNWRRFRARLVAQELGEEYRMTQEKGAEICEPNEERFWREDPQSAQLEALWAVPLQTVEQGCVLVASPTLADMSPSSSHLHQVVIFVVTHSPEQGSIGLILNRPSILSMDQTMVQNDMGESQIRDIFGSNRLYCGGSVNQEIIKVLHRYGGILPGREVIPGVFESSFIPPSKERYELCNTSAMKFFCGHEYWTPGELQKEVDMGMYTVASCSTTLILKNCLSLPIPLWCEINLRLGGTYAEDANRVYGDLWSL